MVAVTDPNSTCSICGGKQCKHIYPGYANTFPGCDHCVYHRDRYHLYNVQRCKYKLIHVLNPELDTGCPMFFLKSNTRKFNKPDFEISIVMVPADAQVV